MIRYHPSRYPNPADQGKCSGRWTGVGHPQAAPPKPHRTRSSAPRPSFLTAGREKGGWLQTISTLATRQADLGTAVKTPS